MKKAPCLSNCHNVVYLFLCALCVLSGDIFSQNLEGINARIDAMGGIYQHNDLGWTVGRPSLMAAFSDQMEGSIYCTPIPDVGETFGAVIAVKSIGKRVYLGITLNERIVMPYPFYRDGFFFLESWMGYVPSDRMAQVPRLYLAAAVSDFITIGIGGFI
jgi:hypothetical protein